MPRNFFNRVEIAVPLEGEELRRVKEECLDIYLKDNMFAWQLNAEGQYERLTPNNGAPFSAQQFLINRYGGARVHH